MAKIKNPIDWIKQQVKVWDEKASTWLTDKIIAIMQDGSFMDNNGVLHSAEDNIGYVSLNDAIGAIEHAQNSIDENTSDGYHTFKELYHYRMIYNAGFFNELARQGKYDVTKSVRHSDGELCFGGGWFIVTANLPTGQVSNHYPIKDWDMFQCVQLENAPQWDGHTPEEASKRIVKFIEQNY